MSPQTEADLGSARILLVDDSMLIREEISRRLRTVGLTVTAVDSGEAAIKHLETVGVPDLVVLDIMMPGMDGYEVSRWMRDDPRFRRVPLLLLTSLDGEIEKVRGLEAGGDDFLTKSAGEAELIARVRSLVALGRMRTRVDSDRHTVERTLSGGADPVELVVCLIGEVALRPEVLREGLPEDTTILWAESDEIASGALRADMVLVPWSDGIYAAQELLDVGTAVRPDIVVVDPAPTAERRVAAYQAGADLYLPGDAAVAEVRARLGGLLVHRRRLRRLEDSRDHAVRAATRDALTGLFNRGYLDEVLNTELERVRRTLDPVCLVMLDVDHFKSVNDRYGHAVGDEVLKEIAERALEQVRAGDVVARFGGEEFAIVLPRAKRQHALTIADRIRTSIGDHPILVGEVEVTVTASLGVAGSHPNISVSEWLEAADGALYAAKLGGRDRVVCDEYIESVTPMAVKVGPEARLRALLHDEMHSPLGELFRAVDLLALAAEPGDPLHPLVCAMEDSREAIREELKAILEVLKPR